MYAFTFTFLLISLSLVLYNYLDGGAIQLLFIILDHCIQILVFINTNTSSLIADGFIAIESITNAMLTSLCHKSI